ncbi:MAG TPA: Nif11 family protein [Clostridiaceae bacterium]|nr:Nif11 family protein [Clostridiaceae bacterium]
MSEENVKLFYEMLAENRDLQEKVKKAGEKYTGQNMDKETVELIMQNELLPLAKEAGFEFTLEELKEFAQINYQGETGMLSDDELNAVVGGAGACVVGGYSAGGCFCGILGFGDNPDDQGACMGVGVFVNKIMEKFCRRCGCKEMEQIYKGPVPAYRCTNCSAEYFYDEWYYSIL